MTTPFNHGRRHFLMGVGGTTLAIPALTSLMKPGKANAGDEGTVNRCFISWRICNGMYGYQWYPDDSASSGLSVVEPNVREMNLSDIDGPLSPLLDESFDPLRGKMNLLRHIDRLDQADHTAGTGLFGWALQDGAIEGTDASSLPPSVDKLMAEKIPTLSIPLNLAVHWSSVGRSCSMSTTPQGSIVQDPGLYPGQAFQQLFVGLDVDESILDRLRAQRLTLVDRALEHYNAVRSHPRLSAADKDLLDEHVQHMQQVETGLAADPIECAPPDDPGPYPDTPEGINDAAAAQVDIAVAALRCGLTRVVNFYLDPDTLMTQALHGVGGGGHHDQSHDSSSGAVQSIYNAHKWNLGYLADFLGKLDGTVNPVTGQTLLDDSLVLVNNEIGNQSGQAGNDPDDLDLNHLALDLQVLMIGSCGGHLQTGKYLDYRTDFTRNRWSQYIGTAYNAVLVTCMLAMDVEPDDWEVNGQPGYGDLRGSKYNMTPEGEVVLGDLRSYLPRLEA